MASPAHADDLSKCLEDIGRIVADNATNPSAQVRSLEEIRPRCEGTGLYEFELGKSHLALREYDRARAVFEQGLKFNTDYVPELRLAQGDVWLHQQKYVQAEVVYRAVLNDYSDWRPVHHALGFTLLAQGKYEDAAHHLETADALGARADTSRYLTIAYYYAGRYDDAVQAFDAALGMDEQTTTSDKNTMLVAVRLYATLGRFDIARNFLALLLRNDPNMREDEGFLKAGIYLRERMLEAGAVQE